MGNIWRMRRPLKVIDLNLNWSLANAYAADPERRMIPVDAMNETLIEFQNQNSGGVVGLIRRVSPVAGLTTSWYGMPNTYFQWSRLTLSGIKRLGAKLPWRKEADTTITNGTNIKTRKQIMNACAMVLRTRSFWLAVMRLHFCVFSA